MEDCCYNKFKIFHNLDWDYSLYMLLLTNIGRGEYKTYLLSSEKLNAWML